MGHVVQILILMRKDGALHSCMRGYHIHKDTMVASIDYADVFNGNHAGPFAVAVVKGTLWKNTHNKHCWSKF